MYKRTRKRVENITHQAFNEPTFKSSFREDKNKIPQVLKQYYPLSMMQKYIFKTQKHVKQQ